MDEGRTGILILGAGLQGSGVALELARRGVPVTLLDRDARPMNRASLRNEGKIHLGFIYANDRSRATALLQLDGALRFHGILKRWIGDDADALPRSTPFHYLVARDSIVAPERLAEHYALVEAEALGRLEREPALSYLGERPERLVTPLRESELAAHYDVERFSAGFATGERAVDTDALAVRLRRAVAEESRIRFLPSRTVRSIVAEPDGFRVEGDGADGTWVLHAAQVVNATWERRLALDRQLGIEPPAHLLHRLKYRVNGRVPAELCQAPSVSMVLGRYGDVVVRPNGTTYLSWYPAGLRGWTDAIEPPEAWDAACREDAPPELAREIGDAIRAGIAAWYPAMARCEAVTVDAGAIVAIGRSDVDDAASGLHDRTHIGVTSRGGYHSVEPGKLTTAPRFAIEAADRVEALRGTRPRAAAPAVRAVAASGTVASPRVVALVPTYRAAEFIEETLAALSGQDYSNLAVLISDDASPDDTAARCARHVARDSRFRLLRQRSNLGWVGNVNALLREAEGELLLFAFQDDLPEPAYVSRCVAALDANPNAVMAYSDIVLVGQDGTREVKRYPELDGLRGRLERARRVARQDGSWWIPNRGVFRADAAGAIGGLRRHAAGEFSADWPWLLHMSLLGEFARVPETLVTKIYQPRSLSRSWSYNAGAWSAVTGSALAAVRRARLPLSEAMPLNVTLAAFASRQLRRSTRRSIGRALRRIGLHPRPVPAGDPVRGPDEDATPAAS